MRFRLASVTAVVAVPVLLAGCSGQEPAREAAAPPPPPSQSPAQQQPAGKKVEGVAWVNRLCGLVGGFTEAQRGGPAVDKSSPQAFKATMVAHLESAAREANETLRGLRAMKPSPIEGADGITASFERGFVQVRDVLTSAEAKAKQVDTGDKRAFLQGMQGVQAELRKGQAVDFGAGFEKFTRSEQLNAAAAQAPECASMTGQQPKQPKQQPQPR